MFAPFARLRVPVDLLGLLGTDNGKSARAHDPPTHRQRGKRELLEHCIRETVICDNSHGRRARGEVDRGEVHRNRAGLRQRERGGDRERIAAERLDRGTRRNVQTRHLGAGEQRSLLHEEGRRALDRVRELHRARACLSDVLHERRAPHDRRALGNDDGYCRFAVERVRNSLRRLERAGAVDVELAAVGEVEDAVVLVGIRRALQTEGAVLHVDVLKLDVLAACRAVNAQHAVREPELGNVAGERVDAADVDFAAIDDHLSVLRQAVVDLRAVRNVHLRALSNIEGAEAEDRAVDRELAAGDGERSAERAARDGERARTGLLLESRAREVERAGRRVGREVHREHAFVRGHRAVGKSRIDDASRAGLPELVGVAVEGERRVEDYFLAS